MPQIRISNLPPLPPITGSGNPLGTDLTPGVDVSDLSESTQGTTKKYTRGAVFNYELEALGFTTYTPVVMATTAALTATYNNGTSGVGATLTNSGAQAALTLDGITLTLGDRVLVKDQVTTYENGIYLVSNVGSSSTNWVLVRALDYNQSSEIVQYGVVLVNLGATYQGSLYQQVSPTPITIGVSAITFIRFQAGAISLPVSLANGGTQANLTANDGGIFYSNATTGAILNGTSTALRMLQSGANSAPSWSTTTWPSTTNVNNILYSSAGNVIGQISTANNGILVTSGAGIPSIGNTVGAGLTMPSITFDSTTGIVGTTTNDVAPVGSVGYIDSSVIMLASAVALTTATAANVTSISLEAGDYDVWGNVTFSPAATTNVVQARGWISTTSATQPDVSLLTGIQNAAAGIVPVSPFGFCVPSFRLSLATTTTVYLSCIASFTVDTLSACGGIYARVRR